MDNFIAYFEARPIFTGIAGATTGFISALLHYLKILGEIAGPVTIIFGCIATFFSMLLVIHKFINRNKDK